VTIPSILGKNVSVKRAILIEREIEELRTGN
jgi:hypothetical protein